MRLLEIIKNNWKVTAGVAALALVIIMAAGPCSHKTGQETITVDHGIALPSGIATHTVQTAQRSTRVPVVGTVMSEETVIISARLPATVTKVLAVTAKKVVRDETLVILDDREIKEQMAAAESQFKQADAEFQRTRKLMDARATTEQAMVAAESGLIAAKAQLDRVKVMLSYTIIKSPMDGIVTERRIEAGDMAAPGHMLMSIYDPSRMRLECPVPVRLVDKLPSGKEVEITLDKPSKVFKGRVSEIVSEVESTTRTQKVKVSIEGTAGDVLPGSFGRLFIEDDPAGTIMVPASAVYKVGQLEMVQVVQNNSAVRRMVRTGVTNENQVEILAGLNNGDKILVNPIKGD